MDYRYGATHFCDLTAYTFAEQRLQGFRKDIYFFRVAAESFRARVLYNNCGVFTTAVITRLYFHAPLLSHDFYGSTSSRAKVGSVRFSG